MTFGRPTDRARSTTYESYLDEATGHQLEPAEQMTLVELVGLLRRARAANDLTFCRGRPQRVRRPTTAHPRTDLLREPVRLQPVGSDRLRSAFSSPPARLLNSSRSLVVSLAEILLGTALIFDALL